MKPAVAFQRELIRDTWDEALDLIKANHQETGALSADDFNPDRASYEASELDGRALLYTMRVEGKLVGYGLFLVGSHPHYPKLIFALQDVLYVSPEHRGRQAMKFVEWQDAEFAREGVDCVMRHSTERKDYGKLLEHMAYVPVETKYIRRLGKEPHGR